MDGSTFLIIGANGQLGQALQQKYPNAKAVDSAELDITNAEQIAAFDWSTIKTILNAAAYTNVDGAETPEGRVAAWQVNALGVANLSKAALRHNLTLVHISTDYVYDGSLGVHTETEPFSPLGVYGQSKAAGDLAASLATSHYILRTSWVIGDGKNFVRTMLGLGEKGVAPTVVADQVGRPSFTTEIVRAIDHLLATQAPVGTYNVSNGGDPISWADFTREIFKQAGYDLAVTDTTTAEYFAGKPGIAPRPLNSTFDLSKLESTSFTFTDWREDLKRYIQEERQQ
ncbi:MAG TPA: NAD(P)-dependent oxidoreductase [Candidatus Saccharimonadales bacterium]|nr:NAD(P)-dependent oxidoreductase [Candidatus Saccharimonadales bacterium]